MAGRLHLRSRDTDESTTTGGLSGTRAAPGDGGGQTAGRASSPVTEPLAGEPVADERNGTVTSRREIAEEGVGRAPAGSAGLTAGLALLGLLTVLIGAWGGIVAYIGPTFGYRANASGSWTWNWQHSLLYLIPGAVAVVTGLWVWAMAARTRLGAGRLGSGLAAVVLLAAGAWFVVGPVVWPIFYSSPVFGPASATNNFVNQLGYNLGPGLILAALGGLTLASAASSRRRPI